MRTFLKPQLGWLFFSLIFVSLAAYIINTNSAREPVLVATHDLDVGTVLKSDSFQTVLMHPEDVHYETMFKPSEGAQLEGAVVARQIYANEPVSRTRLVTCESKIGIKTSQLVCSPRERIIAWPTTGVPLAHLIKGGDNVDLTIIVADRQGGGTLSKTILQKVNILSNDGLQFLMLVPVDLVEALYFARASGEVQFSLEGPNSEKVDTSGMDANQFRQRFLSPGTPLPSVSPGGSPVPTGGASPIPSGSGTPRPSGAPSPTPTPSSSPGR